MCDSTATTEESAAYSAVQIGANCVVAQSG